MKRTIARKTLVAAFAIVFALGILPKAWAHDRRGCSNASLQGGFGFTGTGTLLNLPPGGGILTVYGWHSGIMLGRRTLGRGGRDRLAPTRILHSEIFP